MSAVPLKTAEKGASACCAPGCCDGDEESAVTSPATTATLIAPPAPTALAAPVVQVAAAAPPPLASPGAPVTGDALTATVREKYGAAARRVLDSLDTAQPAAASCCGPVSSCCGAAGFDGNVDPITSNLYVMGETQELPAAAVLASLGCGNPTALAQLNAGEVVLDLGSGGGIDVLLSARRVGPTGKAYGLDMTDDMLDLARRNATEAGITNVEFLRGRIEEIP